MTDRRTLLAAALKGTLAAAMLPLGGAPLRADGRRRIAAIDWAAAESLMALGLPPLAVADTGYFNQRMPQALPPQTQDIGPFWAVNLELLDRLRPDLIFLGAPSLFMTPRLKDIAPVEVVAEGDSGGRSAAILLQCAAATGLPDTAATALLAGIAKETAALAASLAQSLPDAPPVCILLPDQSGGRATIYGKGSMPDTVLTRLGLSNGWSGPVNASGFTQAGMDRLMPLEDAILIQITIPSLEAQTERALGNSQIWQQLPAVRQGRLARISQFYPFGGCLSELHLARSVAKAVLDLTRERKF
ncbi:ABC transporter substrate-binding protein [Pannonibacter phragmitetus]|uniref:ABC transporter substrate-binding protein n=1 Tax=Pannonibacter phragmitetus TaxID=121719 RepID=UPI000F449888|nr:ABC transporter substrate-binding protein [Pannonibacter phragmitetus]